MIENFDQVTTSYVLKYLCDGSSCESAAIFECMPLSHIYMCIAYVSKEINRLTVNSWIVFSQIETELASGVKKIGKTI